MEVSNLDLRYIPWHKKLLDRGVVIPKYWNILEYIGVGYDFQVQKLYSRTVVQVFKHDPEEVYYD